MLMEKKKRVRNMFGCFKYLGRGKVFGKKVVSDFNKSYLRGVVERILIGMD